MVTKLLLIPLIALANFVLGILPSWSLPGHGGWASAVSDSRIWQWVAWANYWVPLDLAVAFIGARLAVVAGMYVFEFITWVLTKAHVLGGAS